MGEFPTTRVSLLARLRDPRDAEAWNEFVAIYTPLIRRVARIKGLPETEADDLVQEVLRAVSAAMGGFDLDPGRGSFRAWLSRVSRNLTINLMMSRSWRERGTGDSQLHEALTQAPAPESADTLLFEQERQRATFQWALKQAQASFEPKTFQAFYRTAIGDEPTADVANALGLSTGAVYVYRNRVMAKIRELVERVAPGDAQGTIEGDS